MKRQRPFEHKRAWYKFIAKSGNYDKTVRVKGVFTLWQLYGLQKKTVLEISCEPLHHPINTPDKQKHEHFIVEGYYRIRQKGQEGDGGTAGIPRKYNSDAARNFRIHLHDGYQKYLDKKDNFARKTFEEDMRRERAKYFRQQKEIQDHIAMLEDNTLRRSINAKIRKSKNSGTQFFQMLAGAQSISAYKPINQKAKQ